MSWSCAIGRLSLAGMGNVLLVAAAGLSTCLALIVAIGAQNAFILRQGIRRDAVLPIVAIAITSDAVLISLGIGGVGALFAAWPAVNSAAGLLGAAFLLGYGVLAARRALRPGRLTVTGESGGSTRDAVLGCLAVTWLNPHTYLDTVLLMGSVANGYGSLRWLFGAGAVLASTLWFVALGFGARLLRGLFARPVSWRVLDGLIAVTMTGLAVSLAVHTAG